MAYKIEMGVKKFAKMALMTFVAGWATISEASLIALTIRANASSTQLPQYILTNECSLHSQSSVIHNASMRSFNRLKAVRCPSMFDCIKANGAFTKTSAGLYP